MGNVLGRRLNVPTLEAAVIDTLHGTSKSSTRAIRDLNDLMSFTDSMRRALREE
jgi:ATP-binding cassette subfamily C protein